MRSKMSIEQRAKQFMPFSALPGLEIALAQVEEETEVALLTDYRKEPCSDSVKDTIEFSDSAEGAIEFSNFAEVAKKE